MIYIYLGFLGKIMLYLATVPLLLFISPLLLNCLQIPKPEDLDNELRDSHLFVTPLLKRGNFSEAQKLSQVSPDVGNVTSYSGFFTVNEECGSNLFFWFFLAQNSEWEKAPVVLWLQGGPGGSSLFGIFEEIGPFRYNINGLDEMEERQYSWNMENNLLIIDHPVGVGYSFTSKDCYAENSTAVGVDLYDALLQFYELFPELSENKFIIAGESYGGHYVPALGYTIHKNNPTAKLKINLTAMMIGNGLMDSITQIDYASYLYQLGLIDDAEKSFYMKNQDQFLRQVSTYEWANASETLAMLTNFKQFLGDVNLYNYLYNQSNQYWPEFIQKPEIRKALHIGNIYFNGYFNINVYNKLRNDILQSVKPWVEELLDTYPMIFYGGQLDIICAYPMMINFLRSLNWSGQAEYLNATRNKWCVEQDLAGYFKGTNHLYDVLVRGAGHMVPADQSLWAYELVNSVTSGSPNNPLHALNVC